MYSGIYKTDKFHAQNLKKDTFKVYFRSLLVTGKAVRDNLKFEIVIPL